MQPNEYPVEVRAAIHLLDEYEHHWEDRIVPDILNLASCTDCILGMVYGSYSHGMDTLVLWTQAHDGFLPTVTDGGIQVWPDPRHEAWVAEVQRRQDHRF